MARKSEQRRQAILDATLDEFESKGFSEARIEDIAKRAGVAKGTVYNYFESKEALLMGLADEIGVLMHGNLVKLTDAGSLSFRERVEQLTAPVLEGEGRGRLARILRVVWSEGLHRPALTRPIFEKFFVPIFSQGGLMTNFVGEADLPPVIKRYPFLLAAPLIQGILWQTLIGEMAPLDLNAVYREYLDFVLGPKAAGDGTAPEEGADQ
ncbi:TetR/AcrR family transcriptional regulator [Sutterella sp.]|uniref:TetR/AcrR family transcriptional regulator n=1 Tax=Sutterella sp. TaxID=1981025 RepID=UPI0026DF220C|nr:TetR/AcrR family transcriptional regulator [Sutterella sp.]MDO5531290.1 TetR/AcrR family transcriptional regulator [Sutterella sp.]